MKKILLIPIVLSAVLSTSLSLADFELTDWIHARQISVPSVSGPTYVKLPLDAAASSRSDNFRSLRIVANSMEEVPYQLVSETASENESFYTTRVLNKSVTAEGQSLFIIDLNQAGLIHDRIEIKATNKNYRRQVGVYGYNEFLSPNDSRWLLLTGKGYVFRYSDERAAVSVLGSSVNYPESTWRYLKVVVDGGVEGPLDVYQTSVYRREISQARENTYAATMTPFENAKEKSTELAIDLGLVGIPTNSITLATGESNFNRRVVAQQSENNQDWSYLAQGYIFRVSTPKFAGENLTISYPENYSRFLRVIVFNEDNRPLVFENRVMVKGTARHLIFEAKPDNSYFLYYGNKDVNSPSYDLQRIFKYLDLSGVPEAGLGGEQVNPAYVAPPEKKKPLTERYPYLLNIVLVVLVLIIAAIISLYLWNYLKKQSGSGAKNNF